MSPNLRAGTASGSTQGEVEQEVDQATARAILQSWSEAKGEDGSTVRTYTQCAQTRPLTGCYCLREHRRCLECLETGV